MSIEIERKWLATPDLNNLAPHGKVDIVQYYLPNGIRARKSFDGNQSLYELTVKTKISNMENNEVETRVPKEIFEALVSNPDATMVMKTRYFVPNGRHTIHLDHFGGELWMAEVEMRTKHDVIDIPSWFGKEVTDDPDFTNYAMSCSNRG